MLGHAKASMTLEVYDDLDGLAAHLDAAMRGAVADGDPAGTALKSGPTGDAGIQLPGFISVELRGFEPLTYSMRTSRATNCAIAPDR
jgi:hypothetical protein